MKFAIGLLAGLLIGCATTISGQLRFQDRELLFHPDKPCTMAYPHIETVCKPRTGLGKVLGDKCTETHKIDEYDLSDLKVVKSLNDGLFSCTSAGRFKY
jgi:hypothetical protein